MSISPRPPLTGRQAEVLAFIRETMKRRGTVPTIRELMLHLGVRSSNGVVDHVRALERKGYVVRPESGTSRNVRLTDDWPCPYCGGGR